MRRLFSRKTFIALVLVIVAGLIGSTAFFYFRWQKAQLYLTNPNEAAKEEAKTITAQLGKLMLLPKDEEPTLATVLDVTKLKDQPFFANAQNGDKMLIYTKSLKAILFRPATDQVINFASLNIGTSSAQTVQPVRIAIYNGTDVVGLTQRLEKDLTAKVTNIQVVSRDNTKRNDYAKTIVVDLSGSRADQAKQLAQLVNGSVEKLPVGEVNPSNQSTTGSVDFLIIVGKDYTGK